GLVLERADGAQLTAPGIAMGTPHYMSPEQALGQRDLDVRSDIYSLGATLFELLSGRAPFRGQSPAAILAQHVAAPMPAAPATAAAAPSSGGLVDRRLAVPALILVAIAAGLAITAWHRRVHPPGVATALPAAPAADPASEAEAVRAVRNLLLARRADDGAYGF